MKKNLILIALFALTAISAQAQRFAYVDSDYILSNIPEYAEAQKQLDEISKNWQKEIENKFKEIDQLYKNYQQEQVLFTEEMKKQKQKEIEDKEKAAKELQKKRFGYEGDLFQKRQELIKPIQDKMYEAISKVAGTKGFDVIFDKSSSTTMLYSNSKLDASDDVIKQLGYTPKQK
ncbi:MAG: OmpH family outer membrane protein [Bacteroidota bacterium]|jgi:outer membrane protein|nr:OmpH family outer membrane protein [Bacteroidota bacterium]GDX48221.1 membrane protein [Bacteroidota bacterium]